MRSSVTICYRFHPHYQAELEVLNRPRERSGAFTVRAPDNRTLKVPVWMTEEKAVLYEIADTAAIDIKALLSLAGLVDRFLAEGQE